VPVEEMGISIYTHDLEERERERGRERERERERYISIYTGIGALQQD